VTSSNALIFETNSAHFQKQNIHTRFCVREYKKIHNRQHTVYTVSHPNVVQITFWEQADHYLEHLQKHRLDLKQGYCMKSILVQHAYEGHWTDWHEGKILTDTNTMYSKCTVSNDLQGDD